MENRSIAQAHAQAQACAACKYQRRKCGSSCILAPYFPHDRQNHFLNAHRLFGVGKITNLLKALDPHQRDIAMTTIIYQSDMRARDPVGGCYNIIHQLQSQIHFANAELQLVLQRLAFFRSQSHHHINNTTTNNNNSVPFLHQHPQFQHVNNNYNYYNASFQEDLNFLALQNSMSLLEDDISQDPVLLDQDYHQNPVLEFMDKMELDSTLHPHHSDDESVLLKVDKAVL